MKVPDYYLEKYVSGHLSDKEKLDIEKMIAADDSAPARLDMLRKANRELKERIPSDTFTAEVLGRDRLSKLQEKQKRGSVFNWRLYVITPMAAAAALLLAINFLPLILGEKNSTIPAEGQRPELQPGHSPKPPAYRMKGDGAQLMVYKQGNDQALKLSAGDTVSAGDRLQLSYLSRYEYGLIYSVDGNGSVTLHFPSEGSSQQKLLTAKETALGHSYALDNAPLHETFYLLTSPVPFDAGEILKKASDEKAVRAMLGTGELFKFPLAKE